MKAVGYMLSIKINYIYTHEQINEPKLKEIPFLLTPDSWTTYPQIYQYNQDFQTESHQMFSR